MPLSTGGSINKAQLAGGHMQIIQKSFRGQVINSQNFKFQAPSGTDVPNFGTSKIFDPKNQVNKKLSAGGMQFATQHCTST